MNQTRKKYYIGLMSGTSADGIDLALVSFNKYEKLEHHASYYQAYDDKIATKITALYNSDHNEIDRAFALDVELAKLFSHAIHNFLIQEQLQSDDIIAIGNHGQTIRHRPQAKHPFSLQIGCCQTLATLTNIRVVGQFRRKDIALGGQGAPLVPVFHQTLFSESDSDNASDVFVVNIGGIANLTFLPANNKLNVIGYDTGTGNALMDDWFQSHHRDSATKYDKNGDWAASGTINEALLTQFLSDPYFQLASPKSTGREYFNLSWLAQQLTQVQRVSNEDVQTTLTALTAITIVDALKQHNSTNQNCVKVYLCGGGVHNKTLIKEINQRLKRQPKNYEILLTDHKGVDADQLEAIAFAWLAFAYDKKLLSSISTVTGASKNTTLGNEYWP